MPHDTPLITTIVAALVLAFIFGAIANRLKMPPIVGYLIAGVCVGPHSPGFVADQTLAPQLAEIGVILLMFGVGLHFSLKDLLSVKAIAIPGALIRMAFATAMGFGLASLLHWPMMGGLVFGLALAVSSTVVTLKVLQDRHLMDSDRGRVAMGWLVVEDLAMVLALVLIPAFAGATGLGSAAVTPAQPDSFVTLAEQLLHRHLDLWAVIGITVIKLIAFVGFMVVVGRRIIPFILHATAHTGSRELFRLAVLAIALGVAAGAAYLFGVSLALGAFFAGMILSESELSQRAAQETLPLRDAFGVLFFVSVGMLFDPTIIVREPLPVIATLLIVIFGKSIVGFLLMILFRRPVASALTISASLAQVGEFSFILAALGIGLGLMPEEGRGLILAAAIISIVLNPLVFWASERLRPRLETRAPHRTEPELGPIVPDSADQVVPLPIPERGDVLEEVAHPTGLNNHVVLIGYGRVGTVVANELASEGAPFLLIEDAEGRVLAAREKGIEVIVGNAATREVLRLANVMGARCVVIAIPNAFEAGQATEQCRKLNSSVKIIARAHSDEEVDYLNRLGADEVIMGEREIGLGMIDWLKGEERNSARRDSMPATPKLSGSGNLLQQARQGQPAAAEEPVLAATAEPMPLAAEPPARPDLPADGAGPAPSSVADEWAAPPVEATASAEPTVPVAGADPWVPANDAAPVAGAEAEPGEPAAAPFAETPSTPPIADNDASAVAPALAAIAADDIQPSSWPAETVDEPAPAPISGRTTDGDAQPATWPAETTDHPPAEASPAATGTAAETLDEAELAAATEFMAYGSPADRSDQPAATTQSRMARYEPPASVFELPAEADEAVTGTYEPPASVFELPAEGDEPLPDARAPSASIFDLPAEADEPAGIAPDWASEARPPTHETTASDQVSKPEPQLSAEADWTSDPETTTAVVDTAETHDVDDDSAPSRASSEFRVVPASDITILPPELVGGPEPPPVEAAAPAFRSEFWEEDEPRRAAGAEPELFTAGSAPPNSHMRNVQEPEPGQSVVDDSTWLAALERDLFGTGAGTANPGRPSEVPPRAPQPIETPYPQEDPAPPAQPIETPRPSEDPVPSPQPIENPEPQEIPPAAPTRAGQGVGKTAGADIDW